MPLRARGAARLENPKPSSKALFNPTKAHDQRCGTSALQPNCTIDFSFKAPTFHPKPEASPMPKPETLKLQNPCELRNGNANGMLPPFFPQTAPVDAAKSGGAAALKRSWGPAKELKDLDYLSYHSKPKSIPATVGISQVSWCWSQGEGSQGCKAVGVAAPTTA